VADAILILNAGSSSLKFAVFAADDPPQPLLRGQIDGLSNGPCFRAVDTAGTLIDEQSWGSGSRLHHSGAVGFVFDWMRAGALSSTRVVAVGHRVVHGGDRFDQPVLIDERVLAQLEEMIPLAPLHQPHGLAAIEEVSRSARGVPQVACFDTAFHRTQPAVAQAVAIPRAYSQRGIRRYGFHGLSYEYIASTLPGIDRAAAAGRTNVAHLGNGASLCAMQAGRSVATTMGFSALDGLVMGTRCGSIDPGVILYLMQNKGLSASEVERILYEESGLLGVSGISSDMRELTASEDPRAREAIDLFVYRAAREMGSMAGALGGLDAVVFTGGIGENAPAIRGAICEASRWLSVTIDAAANSRGGPRISEPAARLNVWVVPTNEELVMARHTVALFKRRD